MEKDLPNPKHVTVIKKYPTYRDHLLNGCWKWIEGKRKDDNASGLWRIHNRLYDLTSFVQKHPGGKYWLEITKGTDITEAFESHHISSKPAELLNSFCVGDAVDPRNYFFTYDKNGFYQTLKRRVAEKLETVNKTVTWKSKLIHDVTLVALFVFSILANRTESPLMIVLWNLLAAQSLAWTVNISHNFAHQADNWRRYSMNISLITWRDFRVFHILSHHMYPNSYADYENTAFEPYYKWIPTQPKSWFYKIFAVLITPVLYVSFFHNTQRLRVQGYFCSNDKVFYWDEFIILSLPVAMMVFGNQPLTLSGAAVIYGTWGFVVIPGEFLFASVFINRGHHGVEQSHQNDEVKNLDFGEYQLDVTVDRKEANYNVFTSLAYFGDQVLHYLFPTLDHAVLPQLRETFVKTCKDFDIKPPVETTMMKATIAQFRQLYRSEIIR